MSVEIAAEPSGGTRSVTRALDILSLLAASSEPLQLAEVARALDLPKSSTLMLLRALTARGFVVQDVRGHYALGVMTFSVGAAYLRTMTPVRSVEPELRALTAELGVTSHFAVLDGDEVLYLAKHDPPDLAFGLASALGARLPAVGTAVGKAQIAFVWDDARIAAHGLVFRDHVNSVVRSGYAVDNGETAAGIRCIAAPVFDSSGCCGAIGISKVIDAAQSDEVFVAAVRDAAGRASGRLGGSAARGVVA